MCVVCCWPVILTGLSWAPFLLFNGGVGYVSPSPQGIPEGPDAYLLVRWYYGGSLLIRETTSGAFYGTIVPQSPE